MEQRGRKSTENLSIVVAMPGQRPEPPEILSEMERAVWRRVCSVHPYDWFHASTHALLADYCRAWVRSDDLQEKLGEGVPVGDDLKLWLRLAKYKDENTHLMMSLATKLRITQQSMRTERNAASGVKHTAQDQRKPWEFGESG